MSIVKIERVRNKYTFTMENGKFASVDLDNRQTPYIGVSGKAVKNCPASIPGTLKVLLSDAVSWHVSNYRGKEFIDRLISLPDVSVETKLNFVHVLHDEAGNAEWMNINWREIVALIRDYSTRQAKIDFNSLYDKINQSKIEKVLQKYNLSEYSEYILRPLSRYPGYISHLEVKAFRAALRNTCKDKYEKSHKAVMELFDCDNPHTLEETFGIRFVKYDIQNAVYRLFDTMDRAQRYVELIGYENYEYTNIERDYINLKTTYERERTAIDNRNFARVQNKYNLSFVNGVYEIYVPTTREELAQIGDTFHNCANGWEWSNRLSNGSFALVVVRNKSTKNMEVCVDIRIENMEISQYYGPYNHSVTSKSLLDFQKNYQKYLRTIKEE